MGFRPGKDLVHVSGQCFDVREREAIADWNHEPLQVTAGRRHAELEKKLASRFGVKHALLCNSGSSANLLALASLELPKGSEVITTACAFPTTVAPIVQLGLVPVFLDVGLDGNVDVEALYAAIREGDRYRDGKSRAMIFAHTLGFPFDVDRVRALCEPYNIRLVADCCDAAGATWKGQQVTALADVSTLSFYPAHMITTGEGGCVLTSNDRLASIARSLRDWGKDCTCPPGHDNTCGKRFEQGREVLGSLPEGYDHKMIFSRLGWNLKMTEMQAAIGLVQLGKLDGFIKRRRETWDFYYGSLSCTPGISTVMNWPAEARPSPFGFLIRSPQRDKLVAALESHRIQTRPLFAGNILRHPCMAGVACLTPGKDSTFVGGGPYAAAALPETDAIMRDAFWIGVYPGVTDEMRAFVVETIKEALR